MPSSNRADLRALVVLGAIAPGLWLPVAAADVAPPSIAAFSHTPGFTEVALSPDGTLLAMDEPAPPNYRIVMLRIKDGQRLRTIAVDGNNKLRRLIWVRRPDRADGRRA